MLTPLRPSLALFIGAALLSGCGPSTLQEFVAQPDVERIAPRIA